MLSEHEIERLAKATAIQLSKLPLPPPQRILNAEQAAAYLGVTPEGLKLWRRERRGPAYKLVGNRCTYAVADLDSWYAALPDGGNVTSGKSTAYMFLSDETQQNEKEDVYYGRADDVFPEPIDISNMSSTSIGATLVTSQVYTLF